VGESTLRLLGDEFESELMGEFYLKGKVEPTRIYRVHGRKGESEARAAAPAAAPREQSERTPF
jgi:class 3 adenylate cyclase